jgi:protein TonB
MLAYASNRPVAAGRSSAPNAMLAIIALHVAAIAALMSARMDLPVKIADRPTIIDFIEDDTPPPADIVPEPRPEPRDSAVTRSTPAVPLPIPTPGPRFDVTPNPPTFDDIIGSKLDPAPRVDPVPTPTPVRAGPRLATAPGDLRPPYPASKLASGEEAVLRLNLTIDERGRVVAVEPIGRVDRTFLDAARRHLLARWRYRPATEDGRAVGATIAVTLRFQLEG